MPLQHFIPATFLANFSDTIVKPRRESIISVGDKRTGTCFTTSVSKVAAIQDLYTLFSGIHPPFTVDELFGSYEGGLEFAIDKLINNDLSADIWVNILVPFVTGFLVRGPDFDFRYQERLPADARKELSDILDFPNSDHVNMGRTFENSRLLASVAVA